MNNTILIILTLTLLITISVGLFLTNRNVYEGLVVGAVTPENTTPIITISTSTPTSTQMPTDTTIPIITMGPKDTLSLVYNDYFSSIIGVIDPNNNPVDYDNNIIGSIKNDVDVIDGNGNKIGVLIENLYANNIRVIDEKKTIIGFFWKNQIISNGILSGVFDKNGALHDAKDYSSIIGFSSSNSSPPSTIPTPFSQKSINSSDVSPAITDSNQTPSFGLNNDIERSNSIRQADNPNIASFNYDSLYNTEDLTPKYSFMNSSFLYKSSLLDENDYLNEIYFNKNPLEMETICKKLDNETCGLTSSCVYVSNNKCVPGNKKGPYTTYSDINLDYYYYRGKCYGNCPGEFGTTTTSKPAVAETTTQTNTQDTSPKVTSSTSSTSSNTVTTTSAPKTYSTDSSPAPPSITASPTTPAKTTSPATMTPAITVSPTTPSTSTSPTSPVTTVSNTTPKSA